jgi:hypothetical protein
MKIKPYTHDLEQQWNDFIKSSKNATFLHDRRYMDYHSDRFVDCSLLFLEGDIVVACFPATYDADHSTVTSHGGLTYGGLLLSRKTSIRTVLEIFHHIVHYYKTVLCAKRLIYKTIPYIYHTYPSDEDLYALFKHNACLIGRGISSAIFLSDRLPLTESRKCCVRKAKRVNLEVSETKDIRTIWSILSHVLVSRHGVLPVHSCEELELLMSRFPNNIKFYATYKEDGIMIAGAVVYITGKTVHMQYMASNDEGVKHGALDLLVENLVNNVYSNYNYFDFGVSTEQGGTYLNHGLIFQKEGFGGRAVCYDTYAIEL